MLQKKLFVFSFAFVLCLLMGQVSTLAQKTKLYDQPTRLVLKGYGEADHEIHNSYGGEAETFYPIGWSKDGKFAYYTEPADEECGCYFAKLIIQDLRTDKVLWKHDFAGDPVDASMGETEPEENIKTHWKKNQKLFSGKLAQHKIVANKEFTLMTSSINNNDDVLTPKLELDLSSPDDDAYYGSKGSVVLRMISKQMGMKTVYEKKYHPTDENQLRTVWLTGYLKSPFEPRVAVILVETLRGHEDFSVTLIRIVGSDLTKGFPKN